MPTRHGALGLFACSTPFGDEAIRTARCAGKSAGRIKWCSTPFGDEAIRTSSPASSTN